jgi:osmotically inducible protein OsmC
MPDKILYTAEAVSTGDGRSGHVTSTDNRIDMDLAVPKEMGGSGDGSNPEQLFAAGYAACFHSALRVISRRENANVDGSTVTGKVGIGPQGQGFGLAVRLEIHLPNVPADRAHELAEAAHQVCPYSNATRGNIPVTLTIV